MRKEAEQSYPNNLVEYLRDFHKKTRGITFVKGADTDFFVSYQDLYRRSLDLLYTLQEKGLKPGDELIFQLEDNFDFTCFFWACLLGKIIPVPVSVGNNDEHKLKLFNIRDVLINPYVILPEERLDNLGTFAGKHGLNDSYSKLKKQSLLLEDFTGNHRDNKEGTISIPCPSDIAYIQFSSGSTGEPNGVVLTHKNLLTNIKAIIKALKTPPGTEETFLSWMPLTHDMGLIGFSLTPLVANYNQVLIPTGLFIRHPGLWLRKIGDYQATITSSPNFGYKYVLKYFNPGKYQNLDLSSLRLIVNGAEPISAELCYQFLAAMAPFGLKNNVMFPAYGLAEASLAVALAPPGEELDVVHLDRNSLNPGDKAVEINDTDDCHAVSFVGIGPPVENCLVRVANKKGETVNEGVIGFIHITGDNVTGGYYHNPTASKERFCPDGWFKTGDLGFFKNNRLFITGRSKELIFVNGQNYYPHDIERAAAGLAGLESGKYAAAGSFNPGAQKDDVIIFVLFRGDINHFIPLARDVKKYINERTGLEIDAVIPVPGIPRTTSGKIQRFKLVKNYEAGMYAGITRGMAAAQAGAPGAGLPVPPANPTEARLLLTWQDVLGLEKGKTGVTDGFFNCGGNSLKATVLAAHISREFAVDFPVGRVFEKQTVRAMAAALAGAEKKPLFKIKAREKREYYPLSSAQKRLFFLDRFETPGTAYNISIVNKIQGQLDGKRCLQAFKTLIRRYEILRTSFFTVNGRAVQKVHQDAAFAVEDVDSPALAGEANLLDPPIRRFIRPFDLSLAPLLRVGLMKFTGGGDILLLDMHHIIADGTSTAILMARFSELYAGESPPPIEIQYNDFCLWQEHLSTEHLSTEHLSTEHLPTGKNIKQQEEYWLNLYADARDIPVLNLIPDYPRPPVLSFAGAGYGFKLPAGDTERLTAVASGQGATLYMGLLAVFNILLFKYTDQDDIVVGSGIMGRPHPSLQGMPGMFVNMLAMRNRLQSRMLFTDFLQTVKENSIKAFENQDVQFDHLIERLGLERTPSRNPLFEIALAVQNFPGQKPGKTLDERKKTLFLSSYPYENKTAKFDITLFVHEEAGEINFNFEYRTALFKEETIKRMAGHFLNIILQVNQNPGTGLREMDMAAEEEKKTLIREFNRTGSPYPYPLDVPVHRLWEERAAMRPHCTAVVFADQCITYKQLDETAGALAAYLYSGRNTRVGEPVGVLMEASLYRIAAVLGILKCGAAFVPIDPFLPGNRIKNIICDAGIGTVISSKRHIGLLNRLQWETGSFTAFLCMDTNDIDSEEEVEKSRLMDVDLWKYVGETAVDEITAGGWINSYTGQPFSKAEMDEYGDNILIKLSPYLNEKTRVFEIGCASGISMYRLAPKVAFYYGCDLSETIIRENRERVKQEGRENIKLSCLAAHEIDRAGEAGFDILIMNSVVQCFHGHNYLVQVLRKAVDLMADTGWLFIGDVMDQDLKDDLIRDLTDFQQSHGANAPGTKTDFTTELFLSRGFFADLVYRIEGIQGVEFSRKIHTIPNELTKFRYDVIISINKSHKPYKTGGIPAAGLHRYRHDSRELAGHGAKPAKVPVTVGPRHPAYIIYTSGTSGNPRGVVISHCSLVNLCSWHNRNFQVKETDHAAQYAGFGFDASVWEVFPYLLKGAVVHVVNDEIKADIKKIGGFYRKYRITISFLPTQMCEQFTANESGAAVLPALPLRMLLTGGDKLKQYTAAGYPLVNNYGPTENCVVTTSYRVKAFSHNIPIGKPIDNTILYILDRAGIFLQPVGVPGELCISGIGISPGYLNNPELTAEKFDRDLWDSHDYHDENQKLLRGVQGGSFLEKSPPGRRRQKLYKTGDLARWLPDGNIEFLGRIDHQVKIRGYRIELGEIENRLLNHKNIKESVVAVKENKEEEKYICAYIVPAQGFDRADLKEYLTRELPAYMVPSYFIELDKLPLSSSGKVDPRRLPPPAGRQGIKPAALVPVDETDKKTREIWGRVLGIEADIIGMDDHFFDRGGHSLKAAALAALIHKEFNVKIPLSEIFNKPVLREISGYIKQSARDAYMLIENVEEKEYYPMSSAQKRVYIQQQKSPDSLSYNMPAAILLSGCLQRDVLAGNFKKLIARHESLRTSFQPVGRELVQRVRELAGENFSLEEYSTDYLSFVRPFDLSEAPLIRVGLARAQQDGDHHNRHILLVDVHHIAADGISIGIFLQELRRLYEGKDLPRLRLRYKDYSRWQNKSAVSPSYKKQEEYWLNLFSGSIPASNLPCDGEAAGGNCRRGEGGEFCFQLGQDITGKLKTIAGQSRATLYMLILAIYNVLILKYTDREDMVTGTVTAGRPHHNLSGVMGMFVNTLAVRTRPAYRKRFRDFFSEVKQGLTDAYDNQDYPLEQLVEKLNLTGNGSRHPLFDHVFVWEDIEGLHLREGKWGNLEFRFYKDLYREVKYSLKFSAGQTETGLSFRFQYDKALFKRGTIERMARHFVNILHQVSSDPQKRISAIEVLDSREKAGGKENLQAEFDF